MEREKPPKTEFSLLREMGYSEPDPVLVRAVKRGMWRLIAEEIKASHALAEHYPTRRERDELIRKFQERQAALFRKSGLAYWPFHLTILDHEKIEKEKTGSDHYFSRSGSILCYTMSNPEISGYDD